ncbi:hypothetical protein [Bradyrhizobium altum]|nr:hypothetical protein [Bradyrhizobium altum]
MQILNRSVATTLMAIAAGISTAAAATAVTPPRPCDGACADSSR